ncbi:MULTISPECIES: hypothetical protein [unclassified Methanosarcina]|uniref:hypothetical protein n=1 Tax=unclassified Methanosarcina TaxID=2644672 RepID=UPI00061601E3|nr:MULTISPECIES: hypothetical protein [unclassified Methanosarcina]AKB18588.1 hypothetical protein MSWHS_1725 [Methanosarcina sp. WWM596]AKB21853.1 hypothetical protein MSWH1_1582 [Methanosarcina sp. WH1]
MGTDEKFKAGNIIKIITNWYDAIKVRPEDKEIFMKILKVDITNPVFHMHISKNGDELDYKKLANFIRGDIEDIEKLIKNKNKYFNKDLHEEVVKFKNYLVKYSESIEAGETARLEEMEKTILNVSEEYSAILDELFVE